MEIVHRTSSNLVPYSGTEGLCVAKDHDLGPYFLLHPKLVHTKLYQDGIMRYTVNIKLFFSGALGSVKGYIMFCVLYPH